MCAAGRAELRRGAGAAGRQDVQQGHREARPPGPRLQPGPAQRPLRAERPHADGHDRALRCAHTIGVTHCDKFVRRIYTFKQRLAWNPPMNLDFLRSLRRVCPLSYSPTAFAMLDVTTPRVFDNAYFNNLRYNKGLLASDQVLFTDRRSRPTVNLFAANATAFHEAFVAAMAKLGRIGLKTGADGEIRRVCTAVN
ncbi:Peroxidase 50 [Zea mays]|uniref:Peroxidase 50 n=1 Tax=Zea mays TaxID=4577 RepID=A0A3L6G0F9_MAIZE|nr:Peroxidase 50 [Zea mays]